jgi:phosphopantothenoylcysteine decarboxylase / phosphopantothenate---cysteine ligase
VFAAAPADFRPKDYADQKIKKSEDGTAPTIALVTNPDIAAEVGRLKRPGQVSVAFAAETQDGPANAARKLVNKNADLIVLNDVGGGRVFGEQDNEVVVLDADGFTTALGRRSKEDVADAVWDLVVARWA